MRAFPLLIAAMILPGCSLHAAPSGVLARMDGKTHLMSDNGRELRIVAGEHSPILDHAVGVSVQLTGVRAGRRIWVDTWKITDGGDGSAPFVGELTQFGSQWVIEDLNSGSTVVLVEESLGDLKAHEGQLVMVSGYVVGAHRINVVRWTLLE